MLPLIAAAEVLLLVYRLFASSHSPKMQRAQLAMELALNTMQRRGDLVRMGAPACSGRHSLHPTGKDWDGN